MLVANAFISLNPVSIDQSLTKNVSFFTYSVNSFRNNSLIAWFKIYVVLVREHLKFFAISLCQNNSRDNSARWLATANGMLCWTKKSVCFTFVCNTLLLKSESMLLLDKNETFVAILIASLFTYGCPLCSVPQHLLFPCLHRKLICYMVCNKTHVDCHYWSIDKLYFADYFRFICSRLSRRRHIKKWPTWEFIIFSLGRIGSLTYPRAKQLFRCTCICWLH